MGDDSTNGAKKGPAERERMRELTAAEFQRFCDRVATQAKARGLTESALKELWKD